MSGPADLTAGMEDPAPENARRVVEALMTGAALKARDVAKAVSRASGREVTAAAASGTLARISDPSRSDLGNFIRKHKAGTAWVYAMAPAALALTPAQAYDLTRKTGAGRYTLVQALREHPALRKEIDRAARPETPQPVFRILRQAAEAGRPFGGVAVNPRMDRPPAEHPIELSVRCSSRYTLSIASSLRTLVLLCIAAILTVAACGMLVYAFLLPASVLAAAAAAGWLGWRRSRRNADSP
ncbi:hypothetical protein [Desulfococcus sp.]|uniref:hypothetical protein n=1 Tax=Desulfococcus sp. TaxID=2025834 RepID=UPI00359345F3